MTAPLTHPSVKGSISEFTGGLIVDGWFKETSPMWPGQGNFLPDECIDRKP